VLAKLLILSGNAFNPALSSNSQFKTLLE